MSTVITMSQTVGVLTNGQTYRVRSRQAETLIAASQATKQPTRSGKAAVTSSNEGK